MSNYVLGIETSCDETAVAIVDDNKNILGHSLKSQIEIHREFGGVVPEVAARGHVEVLDDLIVDCLKKANLEFSDIDAFAATSGPGLIGGVIVGMMAAKTLASVYKKPFLAINHLEAHVLTSRLTNDLEFPFLTLLISGGHCQILLAQNIGKYKKIGQTIDDALGEAFDKVAQMLGLNYPGGPEVEKFALKGDEKRFKFARPLIDSKSHDHIYDFSFSGLKTNVRRSIEKLTGENFSHLTTPQKLKEHDIYDICASFQRTVVEIIVNRINNVLAKYPVENLVISGGVAANRYIFENLKARLPEDLRIITPPISLCTDNGVMIAWAGVEKLRKGEVDSLDFKPRARWEL
ncbi:MAG: tRNA (adenosine(37)-N6)-threonylcarbamoyltransferase complex transferase subunit TsaD [Rickettsiales bacterium]|nr:tRNA (adenosine(37)-N6)-threonylcarbamoyltransferase complex transferase subunit TsaD [Rickettsiales bacterium]